MLRESSKNEVIIMSVFPFLISMYDDPIVNSINLSLELHFSKMLLHEAQSKVSHLLPTFMFYPFCYEQKSHSVEDF